MTEPERANRADSAIALVIEESRLLDARNYQTWLALFTDDGHYWVTSYPEQSSPLTEPSLAYDDRLLMQIRIERLDHPRVHSQKPRSTPVHVLQAPTVTAINEQQARLQTPFTYVESRGPDQVWLAGLATHTLVANERNDWLIREKRIDLPGCDDGIRMVQLFI